MNLKHTTALATAFGLPSIALAGGLGVQIEIPRLRAAEYHRPYVAAWIEQADGSVSANLAVWHDLNLGPEESGKWLRELRQWWRRAGRSLEMPVDGVSGATRPPGTHRLQFTEGSAPMPRLAAGRYRLVVEAAREAGEREVVTVPFDWPPARAATAKATGVLELGSVQLDLKP